MPSPLAGYVELGEYMARKLRADETIADLGGKTPKQLIPASSRR